jgi:hypothetical protein
LQPTQFGFHLLSVLGLVAYARQARREVAVVVAAYVVGFASVLAQNKFYPYHFLILLPPLLVGTCLGLRATSEKLGEASPSGHRVLRVLDAVLLFSCVQTQLARMYDYGKLATRRVLGSISSEQYDAAFGLDDYYYPELVSLSRHISRTTAPTDTVLVYGFDAVINFLANRQSPTRFGFQYPLVISPDSFKTRYRAEFLSTLATRPPKVIVLAELIDNNLYRATGESLMGDFPELKELILHDYALELRTSHYSVFRRR